MNTIAPELVERFRADLAQLWAAIDSDDARLGLAVSGGGDSLALLLLAHAALPGRIEVGTVDHGLRAGSAQEAAFVAQRCEDLAVPCRILSVTVPPGNLQERARKVRYEALARWSEERGLAGLATAHQLDDQAETLLMRLNRGSGLSGLSGIRPRQALGDMGAALVRPLLGWRRTELAQIVAAAGWHAVADPSNEDPRFDRVRLRRAMAGADWLDPVGIARSAALLEEAEGALAWAAGKEITAQVSFADDEARYAALATGAPALIRCEAICSIYRAFGQPIARSLAARIVARLIAGEAGNAGGLHYRAEGDGDRRVWVFRRETPRGR